MVSESEFTPGRVNRIDLGLALSPRGTPYVAFADLHNNRKATAMMYDGSAWVTMGSPELSPGAAGYVSIAVSSLGIPYVAFADGTNDYRAVVMCLK